MTADMPYSIPHKRELSQIERALLEYLISREATERLSEIDNLKVVARCGCGECPTVLFATSLEQEPQQLGKELASYSGQNSEGIEVGVVLRECRGEITELEAWSPHGPEIKTWPPLDRLVRYP